MLTSHNFGRISDEVFNDIIDVQKQFISFTTPVWTFIENNELFLSSTFKELKPIEGNRVCKINGNFYYLTINKGQLINKKRI